MTTPDTKTLVERLRSIHFPAIGKVRPALLVGMQETGRLAADRLEALQNKLDSLPADWLEDSSLATWFPMTAEQVISLSQQLADYDSVLSQIKGLARVNGMSHIEALRQLIAERDVWQKRIAELQSTNAALKNKVRELEDEITELVAGEDL